MLPTATAYDPTTARIRLRKGTKLELQPHAMSNSPNRASGDPTTEISLTLNLTVDAAEKLLCSLDDAMSELEYRQEQFPSDGRGTGWTRTETRDSVRRISGVTRAIRRALAARDRANAPHLA